MRRNGKRRLFCNCIQDTIVLVCKIEIGGRCKSKHDYSRQSTTADQPEILGLYHEKFNEDRYITCETEKVWGKELIYDLKTAEEMWESENADLVILDVNLPDGSGYDFLAFVKESSKVPVIL